MNSFVCILFAMFVVVCSAMPVTNSVDISPCADCNEEKVTFNRVKRNPQYYHSETYRHEDVYTRTTAYGSQGVYGPYPMRMPILEKIVQAGNNFLNELFSCY